jgi:hypothetical protein
MGCPSAWDGWKSLAATHGSIGFLARELLVEIPRVMADLVEP